MNVSCKDIQYIRDNGVLLYKIHTHRKQCCTSSTMQPNQLLYFPYLCWKPNGNYYISCLLQRISLNWVTDPSRIQSGTDYDPPKILWTKFKFGLYITGKFILLVNLYHHILQYLAENITSITVYTGYRILANSSSWQLILSPSIKMTQNIPDIFTWHINFFNSLTTINEPMTGINPSSCIYFKMKAFTVSVFIITLAS